MNRGSVLATILTNQKLTDLAEFDVVELISFLLGQLNQRERDVISRRYGLLDGEREILESIGKVHGLTRERIRQIEVSSIKKLRNLKELEQIRKLRKIIIQLMEEHGGLMERDYLLNNLTHFSIKDSADEKSRKIYENFYNLLMAKILHDDFTEVLNSEHLMPSFRLNYQTHDHFEELAKALKNRIEGQEGVLTTPEIIQIVKELEEYEKNKEKLEIEGNIDLSGLLKSNLYKEDIDLINKHKTIYSMLRAAKAVDQNVFGHWGVHDSPEIQPKNLNDKIYLVLKNEQKPLHFSDIAKKIDEIGFDRKNTNIASAHNELILDKKYVLVGRGLYGLKEWGLKKGTVTDVIEEVLKEADNSALTKNEIIDRVLAKRIVKKTTILLALSNRDKFSKDDGRYAVKMSE